MDPISPSTLHFASGQPARRMPGHIPVKSLPSDSVRFGVRLDRASLALNKLLDVLEQASITDIELRDQAHATLKINGKPYRFTVNSGMEEGYDPYLGRFGVSKDQWMLESLETVRVTEPAMPATRRLVQQSRLWGLIPAKWEDVPATPAQEKTVPRIVISLTKGEAIDKPAQTLPHDLDYNYVRVEYKICDENGTVLPDSAYSANEDISDRARQWFQNLQNRQVFSSGNLKTLEERRKSELAEIML